MARVGLRRLAVPMTRLADVNHAKRPDGTDRLAVRKTIGTGMSLTRSLPSFQMIRVTRAASSSTVLALTGANVCQAVAPQLQMRRFFGSPKRVTSIQS